MRQLRITKSELKNSNTPNLFDRHIDKKSFAWNNSPIMHKSELSVRVKKKLRVIARTLAHQPSAEDQPANDLWFITQKTYDELCNAHNMPNNPNETPNISRPLDVPFNIGALNAQTYLEHFRFNQQGNNLNPIYYIAENIRKTYPDDSAVKTSALIGMGIVLKAYHLQLGPEFLDKF